MGYMNSIGRALGICLLCALPLQISTAFAQKKVEAAKESLNELHEKIDALKKELDNSQEAHKNAADALKESEKAISEANKSLFEISNKQKEKNNLLAQLKEQSFSLNNTLEQQKKLLSAQFYDQYLHGKPSYTQILLQNQDPNKLASELNYFSYIAKARAKLIMQMQGTLNHVEKLNDKTTAALHQVLELKKQQELERLQLQLQKQAKSKVVKSLSSQIASQRNEITKLKRDEKNLLKLVERLARIIPQSQINKNKRNKNKIAKNSSRAISNNEDTNTQNQIVLSNNEVLPSNTYNGVDFASLKGKLNLPARGKLMNRFGAIREDTGISWKGLFIKSVEGSEVKSVASGRVVFADWMRGFGNLIIIDHGNGYMSLYGNNQSVLRKVGDEISGGDTIALVGDSGGNSVNGLYYELRKQSKPFDPMGWSIVR